MEDFLISKFQNPIELFLHIFPKGGNIFGSCASWLGFDIQLHKNNNIKIPQDKAKEFLKFGSDIDVSLVNYIMEIPEMIQFMELFGDVITLNEEGITKIEWKCKNYPALNIDIVHFYNKDSVDFTVNNWVITKFDSNKWNLDCRVKFSRNKPDLTDKNIYDICYTDTINKKINLMISPEKELSQRPKIVARTYKLLNKGYTFNEVMITKMIVPKERYEKNHKHESNDECPFCLEEYNNNIAVLDCGHGLHPSCMQKIFVTLHKEDSRIENINMPRSRYFDSLPIKNQEAPKFRCPMCRHDSIFL